MGIKFKAEEVSKLLESLNKPQRDAVINYQVPSLIVAGAGSGKTRVLTSRIAYMLEQGVDPQTILSLTFTNKAAREMRERIGQMVSRRDSFKLWMGTFHSIFLRILRAEAEHLGYPASFTIYDTSSSKNLVKTIIKDKNLSDEIYKVNAVYSRISLAKNNLVTPAAYVSNTAYIAEDRERKMPEFVEVYKEYARRCKANGAMDFDDMLLNINILFRDYPAVLARYQQQFAYILVDEYQDTNYAQYIIIRRLAQLHSRVCVVGDDAQSIYSFRGAKVENILRFKNDFPAAQMFKLEQNYRSTQTIVNAANSVIEKNQNRIKKESFSAGATGDPIKVLRAYTDQEEASIVADSIRDKARSGGTQWREIAVLYRTNMQSRAFEEAFRRRSVPYRIYGGTSFYQRKEVKDVMAYMQLITNHADNEAFKRVINYPARGIGDVTIGRIADVAQQRGMSFLQAIRDVDSAEIGLKGAGAVKVKEFAQMITELSALRSTLTLYQFGMEVATRSGIIGSYKITQSPEAQSALENIEELLNTMQLFEQQVLEESQYDEQTGEQIEGVSEVASVESWLQNVALLTDMDAEDETENNKVTMMTVHASKGLEFDHVYIVGLEENLFPSLMNLDGGIGVEEERRLFYVAVTRAKVTATLSFSQTRFKWGTTQFCQPSRFLSEMDSKYMDIGFELNDPQADDDPISKLKRKWADGGASGGSYERRDTQGATDRPESGRPIRGAGTERWKSPNPATPVIPRKRSVEGVPSVAVGGKYKSIGVRAVVPAGDDAPVVTPPQSVGEYSVGMRVRHAKFGVGEVVEVERTSLDTKIKVAFDSEIKTLLSKFAKLTILG